MRVNMNFREREVKITYIKEAILCVTFGTVVGIGAYYVFLYFNIAIFGWNLGLIFAPLAAGYAETLLANRIIGQGIGAISAFILFIITTFYSFILKNPTLGFNLITVGSVAVILQAAFPTAVNYIILSVIFGIGSYLSGICTRIITYINRRKDYYYYKHILKEPNKITIEKVTPYDEQKSNEVINNLDFYFITSTDPTKSKFINLGQFHATAIVEKDKRLIHSTQANVELATLNNLKKAKDKSLIRLAQSIKSAGGNGVINLKIEYGLIGLGGDSYQITAMGMGVYLK